MRVYATYLYLPIHVFIVLLFQESMRLYPPVPLIARNIDEDVKVGKNTSTTLRYTLESYQVQQTNWDKRTFTKQTRWVTSYYANLFTRLWINHVYCSVHFKVNTPYPKERWQSQPSTSCSVIRGSSLTRTALFQSDSRLLKKERTLLLTFRSREERGTV